ncbi:MAG TPA: AzlC family ABC transporter permease [Xanthobacteraceae bacterium]
MTDSRAARADRPTWSLAGLRLGASLLLPALPGMMAFAVAVGATEARKGFDALTSLLMNICVYAGASQLVAMEVWPAHMTAAGMAALALVVATVNARMLLFGASLRPWLGPLPAWQIYPLLQFTTDPGWLVLMRYRAKGGNDAAVFVGGAVVVLIAWVAATMVGYAAGALVADPRKFALDLVLPIFFAAMLVPLWRGRRRTIAWGVAGAVALATQYFVSGWWFVIVGAIAGSVAEGFAAEVRRG